MLLIDPCLDPQAALRQDLRHEITRRVMRRGSAGENREDLLAQLERGEAIVVDGQRLSPALFAGLVAAAPAQALEGRGERATVLKSGRSTFPGRPRTRQPRRVLRQRARTRDGSLAVARTMTRTVLTLPGADGAELVAVVHEPAGPPTSVIVLMAGGVLPRMGVNRVLVRMADRLAAAGHRAVRVDPGGLGESGGTLPEEPFFDLLRRVESGAFVDDVRLTAEAVAPAEADVPLVLFGTCGGGITALRVAEQLDRVTGVIAVGVPLKRSGARIPPGFARRTERRRALRQLAELRHRTGSGRVRRVIRPLVWSLMPRLSRRLPDDADRWLNTPLLGSMRALYARRLPVSLLYGENDIVRDEIEELFLGLHRLGERPWFELGLIPAVGHQLDDPDEVDAVAERIQRFAEQLRTPAMRTASATSCGAPPCW